MFARFVGRLNRMSRRWSAAVAAVCAGLVVNAGLHAVWFGSPRPLSIHLLVDGFVLGGSVLAVAYGSLLVDEYERPLARRAVAWTLSGGVASALIAGLSVYGGSVLVRPGELVHALQLAVPAGVAVGLVVGLREARFVEVAREAERARTRAASLARQRRTLERLNDVLRHHVLNGANVIAGHAELLCEETPPDEGSEPAERLETVREHASRMAETVDRVRTLIRTATDEPDPRSVDVVRVLERELEWAREEHPEASFRVDLPERARVVGDELLSEAFHELLANALEHGGEEPTVEVAARREGDAVTVRVRDDGPGLPEDEPLFELAERGDGGLGLHLVRNVVGRYGEVAVEETGESGTTVRVDLDRCR